MKSIQDYLARSNSKSKNSELVMKDDIPLGLGAAKNSTAAPDSSHAVEEEYVSKRKLTSSVWKEFKRKKIDSKWKAECLWCHKRLGGDTKNGTKHLHDHLSKCPRRRSNKVSKPTPSKCTKDTDQEPTVASLESSTFSQDVARMELARMIILHEYPLSIMEHYGFQRFVRALQPLFQLVPNSSLKKDVISIYETERVRTREILWEAKGRIAITADIWTSDDQNRGYVAVRAHFIDQSWTFQCRLLSFIHVPWPHTAQAISETLSSCLNEWNLGRRVSMVMADDCSTDDTVTGLLKQRLDTEQLLLGGSLLNMRCCAYVLSRIANSCLGVMGGAVDRIRASVDFWTATTERDVVFADVARGLNVNLDKKLTLDRNNRWYSTLSMLNVAISYKQVFDHLRQIEEQYICAPDDDDWKIAKEFCSKLKLFSDIAELISEAKYVTANMYFPKICGIRMAMRRWPGCEDELIGRMRNEIAELFEKYCVEVHDLMAVATVLDPRYKLELLQFYFPSIFGDEAYNEINRVRQLCYDLIKQYQGPQSKVGAMQPCGGEEEGPDQLSSFDLYIAFKFSSADVKSELDKYLDEPVIPRAVDFDIIDWWKIMGKRFPTLQMLARDILAVPVSRVVSESAFSIAGRVLSPQRSNLLPDTLEALMCSQDWLRAENRGAGSSGLLSCLTCLEDADVITKE